MFDLMILADLAHGLHGSCSGLIFRDSYNWDCPPGDYIHIDAFIPGCPPKPEAILAGMVKLMGKN